MDQQDIAPPWESTRRSPGNQEPPLPRPEVEKPFTAETAINRALGADTTPGAIARSDDAPHIWSEIRQLGVQFGRLEKQVEITTATVEGHRTILHSVSVNSETLCAKHEQFKRDIDTLSGNITNTLNGLLSGVEGRLNGKIDSLSHEIKGVTANGASARAILDALVVQHAATSTQVDTLSTSLNTSEKTLQALNTNQTATLQAIRLLSPIVKWGISGIAALVVAGFGLSTWLWKSSIEPKLIEDSAKRAQHLVEESMKSKALQAENEKLKAENEALRKGQNP